MGAAIESQIPDAAVELIPGGRGDFIVVANDRKLWDKRAMGDEFPEHEAILSALR